jgi:hypothetical protein
LATQAVTWISIVLCVVSFALFVYFSFTMRVKQAIVPKAGLGGSAEMQSGLSDMAKLVEALAKLADSFAKAGPAVMSLVASILFLLVATIGAGVDKIAAAH